ITDTVQILNHRAEKGKVQPVFLRVGETKDGWIVIDLGTRSWDAIVVRPDGWTVTSRPPVKFRRSAGMLSLPYPRTGWLKGRNWFQNLLRVDQETFILLAGWCLAAFRPRGPYPILVLQSRHGSGKTVRSKMIRRIVDPNEAGVRSQPRSEHDLIIAA